MIESDLRTALPMSEGTHIVSVADLEAAAEKTCCCRTPSQNSLPFWLGTFQEWLPITRRGDAVCQPSRAGLSGVSAPLFTHTAKVKYGNFQLIG
jgi:hypothetical protein